ncbi:MAG: TorD/DmsD family molecular chaperone [Burkholderiales bacterium]
MIQGRACSRPFFVSGVAMSDHDPRTAAARADLCRYLAACYYQPALEFAEEKLFESMVTAASQIDPELAAQARRLGESFVAEGIESLLVDYTRLFLGPTQIVAKPYGSFWLSGEHALMQDSTIAVLNLYREGGFEIDDNFRELPDHIAAELEFLYLLIFRENEARLKGDAAALPSLAAQRKRFLHEHLGRWVPPFSAAIKSGAQSAFYSELARLTDSFVAMEARRAAA